MYQYDNAPAHTSRLLTVNFLAVIIIVLDYPPLSPDMSSIKLLITTLKSKGMPFERLQLFYYSIFRHEI